MGIAIANRKDRCDFGALSATGYPNLPYHSRGERVAGGIAVQAAL